LFLLFFAAAEATSRDVRSPLVTSTWLRIQSGEKEFFYEHPVHLHQNYPCFHCVSAKEPLMTWPDYNVERCYLTLKPDPYELEDGHGRARCQDGHRNATEARRTSESSEPGPYDGGRQLRVGKG
jgi:hypothetical protein